MFLKRLREKRIRYSRTRFKCVIEDNDYYNDKAYDNETNNGKDKDINNENDNNNNNNNNDHEADDNNPTVDCNVSVCLGGRATHENADEDKQEIEFFGDGKKLDEKIAKKRWKISFFSRQKK